MAPAPIIFWEKTTSACGAIKRMRFHLPSYNVLSNVYKSLVKTCFDYSYVLGSNCGIDFQLQSDMKTPKSRSLPVI